MKRFSGLLFLATAASAVWAQSYNISSFAGGVLPPLPASPLAVAIGGQYAAVAADASGNVYIADSIAQVVYRLSGGTLTVLAGTGQAGYSGDGGPAINAELNTPRSVAVDQTGAVYIGDMSNYRVRKVVNGVISTVAGNGTFVISGDGGPATAAGIYVFSIAVDSSGVLYINGFASIRKVSGSGIITTIAGSNNSGYNGDGGPAIGAEITAHGITADSTGSVYIVDGVHAVVRQISSAGIINTIAGNGTRGYSGDGGPALAAQFAFPEGIALDTAGNIYVADTENAAVRIISPSGTIHAFAGIGLAGFSGDGGPATNALLNYPDGVSSDGNGNIFIADTGNRRTREVSAAGVIATIAGDGFENEAGDGGPAVTAQFFGPTAVATTRSGSVLIGDGRNNVVREVSSAGIVTRVAGNGSYGYSGDGGPAIQAQMTAASGVAADGNGNIYISDSDNAVIRRVAPGGVITTFAGNGTAGYYGDGQPGTNASLNHPGGLAVKGTGDVYNLYDLYIADTYNNVIRKMDPSLTINTVVGQAPGGFGGDGGPAGAALLAVPAGLNFDAQGNMYIADSGNNRIREVSASTGIITTIAGNGVRGYSGDGGPATSAALYAPSGVAIDASGNVYIADQGNNVVRKVSASGIVTTIAGAGPSGYLGYNGPALDAEFNFLTGVAVDPGGAVYVADYYNNAVPQLTVCPVAVGNAAADSAAQTVSSPLTAASTCQWTASNLPLWITNAPSGAGTGALSLVLQANDTGAGRSATLNVNGLPVTVTQAFTTQTFADVVPSNYYFDAVDLLKEKMITSGCTPVDYCPTMNVTRAQMAIFLVRAILGGDTFSYSPAPYFTDVQPLDFGFPWIQKLYELGITTGCAPGLYCSNNSVTRAQMAAFIIRARYGAQTAVDYPGVSYFTDVPPSAFAFNYIQRMKEDNITSGCSATTYCPANPVTRGDMAIFIMRGAFNQLLPPAEPVISAVTPATIANGATATLTVTGLRTNFAAGSTAVNAVPGLAIHSVTVLNATTLQVSVTANTAATPQPLSIWVTDPAEEAVLPNGLAVQ